MEKQELRRLLKYLRADYDKFVEKYNTTPIKEHWCIKNCLNVLEKDIERASKRLKYLTNKQRKHPVTGEPMYTTYDVEQIKEHTDPQTVIGQQSVQRMGNKDKYRCPLGTHEDKNPSFIWNKDKKYFKCFSCGEGGDIIALYMKLHKCDFREALKNLS